MIAWLGWTVAVVGSAVGLAGIVLPFLPGLGLIFASALIFKVCVPDLVSWWTLGGLAGMVLLGMVVEWLAGAIGVRWLGGSRWAMGGALVGALVGLFFGLPGLILGPLAGAVLAEILLARRPVFQAARASAGVAVGWGAATVVKLILGLGMLLLFWGDVLFWR